MIVANKFFKNAVVQYDAEALDTVRRDVLYSSIRDPDVVAQTSNSTMSSKNGDVRRLDLRLGLPLTSKILGFFKCDVHLKKPSILHLRFVGPTGANAAIAIL